MPKAQSRPLASFLLRIRKVPSSISTGFNLALRYFRFQVLPQTTRWKQDHEETKVATYDDRRVSLLGFLLHTLPFAGVLALIILNVQPHYIGEVSSTTITAIQFAAKLLEILIQSSLAAILLDLLRSQALGPEALPLGSFLAPYRLTDISYLWSLDFWGSATSKAFLGWRRITIVTAVVASVLLAALVGPASAVAMIPRRIDYPISQQLVLGRDARLTFPHRMSLVDGQLMHSEDVQQSLYQVSHSSGPSLLIVDTAGSRILTTNTNYVEASSETDDLTDLFVSTIPTQAVTLILTQSDTSGWNMAQAQALQPWVQSSCSYNYAEDIQDTPGSSVSFGDARPKLNDLIVYSDLDFSVKSGLSRSGLPFVARTNSTKSTMISWFALNGTDINHSSLLVSTVQYAAPLNSDSHYLITACVIDAIWYTAPVKYTVDSNVVSANESAAPTFAATDKRVIISPEWADAVTGLYLSAMPQLDALGMSTDIAQNAAPMLALGMADASNLEDYLPHWHDDLGDETGQVTRFTADHKYDTLRNETFLRTEQYDSIVRFMDSERLFRRYDEVLVYAYDDWTDPSSLAQYPVKHYTSGYGYDSSTIPVRLSLVVLALYLLAVTVYTAYSLVTGHTATSWDSIGELVMLALGSRQPEHIKGCTVGIETLSTYRKPVNIRVHKTKNEAEMIFEDDPGLLKTEYKLVEPNERY